MVDGLKVLVAGDKDEPELQSGSGNPDIVLRDRGSAQSELLFDVTVIPGCSGVATQDGATLGEPIEASEVFLQA